MKNKAIILREKVGRLVELIAERKIRVTQAGTDAYVRYSKTGVPELVNIPYIPEDASTVFMAAIEGFLDHEVAHVLFSDYKAIAKGNKAGVKELHNIIEDAFIEKKMADTFPGSGLNLRNVGEYFLDEYVEKKLKEGGDPMGLLIVPAIRAWSGQSLYKDFMKDKWHLIPEVVARMGEYAEKTLPGIRSSQDGLNAALEIKKLLELPEEEEGEDGSSKPRKGATKAKSKKGAKGAKAVKMTDKSDEMEGGGADPDSDDSGDSDDSPEMDDGDGEKEPGEDSSEEGEGEDSSEKGGSEEKEDKAEDTGDEGSGDSEKEKESEEKKAPEEEKKSEGEKGKDETSLFDRLMSETEDYGDALSKALSEESRKAMSTAEYRVYSTDFDVIKPLPVNGFDDYMLTDMQKKVDTIVGPLQKDLERAIAARSAATWASGFRSGKLHAASLARLTTFGDTRVFRRKHVGDTKDVAVTLLIDCSGSMCNDGKIRVAGQTAYGLSSVLEKIGINHEVLGFTTVCDGKLWNLIKKEKDPYSYARSEPLATYVIKEFTERLNNENRKRFACVASGCVNLRENVDGESLLIAATRLDQRREKRKIIMVLSDGQPACPPGNRNGQLKKHLVKAVKTVESHGIETLGIGILTSAPKNYYPKSVVLNNLSDLPTTVIAEIKKLLVPA
ncbi:hypothetical protein LJC19_04755 [Oxalobacter sp. OttesenSCG-928-P03]|nr:hypothetical protein [Oxalobacter sp. OttesenSCG-928-P03]